MLEQHLHADQGALQMGLVPRSGSAALRNTLCIAGWEHLQMLVWAEHLSQLLSCPTAATEKGKAVRCSCVVPLNMTQTGAT